MEKNLIKKIIKAVTWILALCMIGKEILIVQTMQSMGNFEMDKFILSILLLLLYVIPIFVFSVFLLRKEKISIEAFLLAFVAGGYIIGSLAGSINYYISNLLLSVEVQWIPSIVPPFTEELLKIGIVLLIAYIFQFKTFKSWLAIGMVVGVGFQFSEDYAYILSEFVDGHRDVFGQAFQRIQFSFSTHWLITGIFAVALYFLWYKKDSIQSYILVYLLLFSWIYHILWNSPFVDGNSWIQPLLSAMGWFTFIFVFYLNKTIEKLKE